MMNMNELITLAAQHKATDVFITADAFPAFRMRGEVEIMTDLPRMSISDCENLAYTIMTPEQISRFERRNDLDLSFVIPDIAKVRASVYKQRQSIAIALRLMQFKVPNLVDLNMPSAVTDMLKRREGLILVTGPTGSGKSTTLAAMVHEINQTRKCHIITVEDPIEYTHTNEKSIISQRQIGVDVDSFNEALRYVLRQNPDVILVGEMRDMETVHVAMSAAETGHLVLSTLHTCSASETLERMISLFPPHDKAHVGVRLSASLAGIVSQKLVNKADDSGVVAAVEVLVGTPTISALILEGKSVDIHEGIASGGYWGMQTMNQCLVNYIASGIITREEAVLNSPNIAELKQLLRK